MATREQLVNALKAADAAGNADDARRLAAALSNMTQEATVPLPEPSVKEVYDKMPFMQKGVQAVDDALRLGSNGLTFGFRDKMAHLLGGQTPEAERAKTANASERAGTAGSVLELGGAMLPAIFSGGATATPVIEKAGPVLKTALQTAIAGLEGAGWGGVNAVGHDQDPIKGMEQGSIWGAGGNIVAKLLGAAGNKIGDLAGKKPRLSVDDLAAQKDAAYQAVDDAGVQYTPGTVKGMLAKMDSVAQPYPGRHNETIATRKQIGKNLQPPTGPRPVTLSEVDKNRQIVNKDLGTLQDRAQQDMGSDMTNAMDDYLRQVPASGVTARSGDPQMGIDAMEKARELNARMRKLEETEAMGYKARVKAEGSLTQGEDSTIKTGVQGILTNPKKARNYTPDEIAAMEEVNAGTTKQNIERQVGRMAPGGGAAYYGSAAAGVGMGLLSQNPYVTIGATLIPPVLGLLGKKMSAASTRKSAEKLIDLVASGGKAAPKAPGMGTRETEALGKLLMMMHIQQGNREKR